MKNLDLFSWDISKSIFYNFYNFGAYHAAFILDFPKQPQIIHISFLMYLSSGHFNKKDSCSLLDTL